MREFREAARLDGGYRYRGSAGVGPRGLERTLGLMMLGLGDGSGSYHLRHRAKGVSDTLTVSGLCLLSFLCLSLPVAVVCW